MVSYQGIFLNTESAKLLRKLEQQKLPIINDRLHCTLKYHPLDEELIDQIVNEEVEITILSYGCNGHNSGFKISIEEKYKQYYIENNSETPHITTSLAEGAKATDTKNLEFKSLEKPVVLKGNLGYWKKEQGIEYLSFANSEHKLRKLSPRDIKLLEKGKMAIVQLKGFSEKQLAEIDKRASVKLEQNRLVKQRSVKAAEEFHTK